MLKRLSCRGVEQRTGQDALLELGHLLVLAHLDRVLADQLEREDKLGRPLPETPRANHDAQTKNHEREQLPGDGG